ncbi:hypothetical protein Taro_003910 [Colocasia esculenta]|uniref:Uncharacterized protein n=1 Tax=Colocasia esculenta TaxID=4460 RepID=A0A843TN29_COLES|nr:hypothetical protein [Colocasia esculenta]
MRKAFLPQGDDYAKSFKEFNTNRNLLGTSAMKKVYIGFNQEEGIQVAWNPVRLYCFADNPK